MTVKLSLPHMLRRLYKPNQKSSVTKWSQNQIIYRQNKKDDFHILLNDVKG